MGACPLGPPRACPTVMSLSFHAGIARRPAPKNARRTPVRYTGLFRVLIPRPSRSPPPLAGARADELRRVRRRRRARLQALLTPHASDPIDLLEEFPREIVVVRDARELRVDRRHVHAERGGEQRCVRVDVLADLVRRVLAD